jgi:hypothetical protein
MDQNHLDAINQALQKYLARSKARHARFRRKQIIQLKRFRRLNPIQSNTFVGASPTTSFASTSAAVLTRFRMTNLNSTPSLSHSCVLQHSTTPKLVLQKNTSCFETSSNSASSETITPLPKYVSTNQSAVNSSNLPPPSPMETSNIHDIMTKIVNGIPPTLPFHHTPTSCRVPLRNITSAVINESNNTNTSKQQVTQPSLLSGVVHKSRKSFNIASLGINLENRFANVNIPANPLPTIETTDPNPKRKLPDLNLCDDDISEDNYSTTTDSSEDDDDYVSQSDSEDEHTNNSTPVLPQQPLQGYIAYSFFFILFKINIILTIIYSFFFLSILSLIHNDLINNHFRLHIK